jgi:hypothetical protein
MLRPLGEQLGLRTPSDSETATILITDPED